MAWFLLPTNLLITGIHLSGLVVTGDVRGEKRVCPSKRLRSVSSLKSDKYHSSRPFHSDFSRRASHAVSRALPFACLSATIDFKRVRNASSCCASFDLTACL